MSQSNLTVILLTFNSEASIREVIEACIPLQARTIVVDSYSNDKTIEIATEYRCEIVQHHFEHYSAQRNWAQQYAQLAPEDWVLHLDSDEVLSPELTASILHALRSAPPEIDGYLMQRLHWFMGKPIRYGSINPSWHLRLYRVGKGSCEERLYDQHFIVPGKTEKLKGLLHDLQLTTLEKWTLAHNRWSTAEALEVLTQMEVHSRDNSRQLRASLSGDLRMKKRWIKNNIWYRTPLLFRCFIFFLYSYFIRLGFLDGKTGLIYHVLQSFWFRFLVDAKIVEKQQEGKMDVMLHPHRAVK
jgi:glycosyltransferase involved in cell wall biosynthesis